MSHHEKKKSFFEQNMAYIVIGIAVVVVLAIYISQLPPKSDTTNNNNNNQIVVKDQDVAITDSLKECATDSDCKPVNVCNCKQAMNKVQADELVKNIEFYFVKNTCADYVKQQSSCLSIPEPNKAVCQSGKCTLVTAK